MKKLYISIIQPKVLILNILVYIHIKNSKWRREICNRFLNYNFQTSLVSKYKVLGEDKSLTFI